MKICPKIAFVLLLISSCLKAQNLVPNPSFETKVSCPTNPGQITRAQSWTTPTQGSPDYFNSCDPMIWGQNVPYNGFGYQPSHSGQAYAGFYAYTKGATDNREYVQTKLIDTLTNGHKYLISFYVNLSDGSQMSISNMGAYISANSISSSNWFNLPYSPQIKNSLSVQLSDSVNWILISDTLLSNGTEQYITIGNFDSDSQTDTSRIGNFGGNDQAYYYIDDVSVIDVIDLGISEASSIGLKVFPNPANSTLNIESRLQDAEIKICDVLGNELRSERLNYKRQIDIGDLPKGVYFLYVRSKENIYTTKFVKE